MHPLTLSNRLLYRLYLAQLEVAKEKLPSHRLKDVVNACLQGKFVTVTDSTGGIGPDCHLDTQSLSTHWFCPSAAKINPLPFIRLPCVFSLPSLPLLSSSSSIRPSLNMHHLPPSPLLSYPVLSSVDPLLPFSSPCSAARGAEAELRPPLPPMADSGPRNPLLHDQRQPGAVHFTHTD